MDAEPRRSSAHLPDWARTFQRAMFEAGYLVPGWPPELGGRNATPQEQMTYFEVITERMVPRSLNPQGLSICAASIVEFGSEEQKERYVLPTLKGEITWCLGMSEPNAGSDLASLTTRAERRGDTFVVNGQKVWTSGAHDADFCLCLRPDGPGGAQAPRHQRPDHRHADARHHVPPAAGAHRPRARRLQRGVLHRRRGAGGQPARRAEQRVGGEPGLAPSRAGDALDHERVEDRADARRPRAGGPASGERCRRPHARRRPAPGRGHRASRHRRRRPCAAWATAASPSRPVAPCRPSTSCSSCSAARPISAPAGWPRRRWAPRASTSRARDPTGSPSGSTSTSGSSRFEMNAMNNFFDGSWAVAVPALVRRHDRRRDLGDPAQHRRRACARPSPQLTRP